MTGRPGDRRTASLRFLDLRSPTDLERAEDLTGATARAIAHEPALRFRANLLHLGSRPAPARAPHVRPPVDAQDVADLRGAADGIALRVLHSDPRTYAEHRPEGALEDLLYEILEQFRVEALASAATVGIRANLARRFEAWSDECVIAGLLENHIGLLLFSAVHVCRSRILAEPVPERVDDYTESTRFGIYEVMGQHLRALRPAITDQAAFAPHAAAIATAIGALAAAEAENAGPSSAPATMLAMLAIPEFDAVEEGGTATPGDSRSRLGDGDGYAVFTDAYDRILPVGELVLPHAQRSARAELDALVAEHRPLGALLRRSALRVFPEPVLAGWESEQEEGYLDPRLLVGLVSGRSDGRLYRREAPEDRPRGAVTILVDCSGSMKAVVRDVAALVDLLVRALDDVDVVTEVLGYTTGAWSGGRPYREWLAGGRPAHPGRLNEVDHIVFKDAGSTWRRSRGTIAGLLWTPMFREGLDGEALEWAYGRLRGADVRQRHLLVVCDGSPMDGATTLANGDRYLDRHFAEVVEMIEAAGDVQLCGLGIGHDLSSYLGRSRIVEPGEILHRSTAQAVVGFLAAPAGNFGNPKLRR